MKLYIKQKVFSWGARFRIFDIFDEDRYSAEGEVFTLGRKLHLYSAEGEELAFIHQKLLSFLPTYFVSRDGIDVAQVVKEFTFGRQSYTVGGPGWHVDGDFFAHEYRICSGDGTVAFVSKKWFSWGDSYEVDITDGEDEVMVLAVVLIIDAVLDAQNSSSSAAHSSHN